MKSPATGAVRRPRADAARNRERLIDAAAQVFGGTQARSLESVARRAGLGIGTLYRHFPTREALFEAVYRREVDQLAGLAEHLCGAESPKEALRTWLHANVRLAATKRGMVEALQLAVHASDLKAYSFDRLTRALALLLDQGVAAGELRPAVSPEDLLRTIVGIFYADRPGDWQAAAHRIVDVLIDGLTRRRPER